MDQRFEQWFSDQQRWLRAVVAARLTSQDEVDEVMQEIAVAVVKDWSKLREIERAGPWLYRIAVRQVLLFRRKIGRQRKLIDGYGQAAPAAAGGQEPIEWLLNEERGEAVRSALSDLAPRDREMILLKHGEGWSYQDIAEQLGVSRHVVEYRLLKARKRLRAILTSQRVIEVSP